ncbi:MAG TPA: MotA/TolQ/ExbB proton channel family protein [Pseudomonadales bacterium]
MKHKSTFTAAAVMLLSMVSTAASAVTYEEIMAKIREAREAEAAVIVERENDFRGKLEEQERLVREATRLRDEAEALSGRLDQQYAANEQSIEDMNTRLLIAQGNLGELFGVTRQIAGDVSGVLSGSLINTQLVTPPGEENRVDFLRRVAAATALPSLRELEDLWLALMVEMKNDAEVVRYTTPVLQEDGITSVPTEVVRIGSFGAIGDGEYLGYLPSSNTLAKLSRQPPDRWMMNLAEDIQENTSGSGYVPAVVDASHGPLLGLYVERPDIVERIEEGEVVGWVIVAVGVIGVIVALLQYLYLFYMKFAVSAQLKRINQPQKNNPLGRLLLSANETVGDRPEVVELRISEAVLREIPKLERFQAFLRLAVAAGPLLGLIGTVIGMIITFDSITASGSSDPKLMAEGIGQAMIATVLGLGIAIPLLFLNAGLVSLSRSVVNVLEEQSTRLLATRLEQTAH